MLATLFVVACGGAQKEAKTPQARAGLGPPRVTPGELDARVLLGELPARAQKLGAGPVALVAAGEVVEGERLGAFVDIPPDACLLGYARGSTSIEDLDVAAFADEGNPVAVDEGPDPRPTMLVCPPHPDRVYLAARAASGDGLVALAAHIVPREVAVALARAIGAHGGTGGGPRPAEAWPGLDDHVRARQTALGGSWQETKRIAVAVDARAPTAVSLPIEPDQCVDALVVPDDDVSLLEVEVGDGEGRVIARARDGGVDRSLTVCSPLAFTGTLWVRPHIGRGLAAVVLAKARGEVARDITGRVEIAWVAPSQPLDATKAARNAALAKAGYGAPAAESKGQLVLGRRTSVPLELVAPGCSRVDVVAGAPLALIAASLWEESAALPASASALVASGEGADAVTLFACGPAKGKARLDLETRGRPGPFAVMVRKERWQDATFTKHPLAAGRMLSRAADGPTMLHEGSPLAARTAMLEPSRLISWEQAIAPGKCLRVAAGAEGDGTGLEARIFDVATSDELDRSHAQNAVSVRACAAGEKRQVRVELRSTSGRLEVVVGERSGG
jgi:hypothetical protein